MSTHDYTGHGTLDLLEALAARPTCFGCGEPVDPDDQDADLVRHGDRIEHADCYYQQQEFIAESIEHGDTVIEHANGAVGIIPAPHPKPPRSSGPAVAGILALLNGDPIHDRDRERIVTAILDEAAAHDGLVDPNRVRARLTITNADGSTDLVVYPRLIGAVYHGLAHKGALEFAGWIDSTDTRGGNAGRPARSYRLNRNSEATA